MFDIGLWGGAAGGIAAIGGVVTMMVNFINKDVKRDISDISKVAADLHHDQKNDRSRIDALEHLRTSDVERIVKLETSLGNVEKLLDRIERGQKDAFDALAESIREIRVVAPKA